MLKLYIYRGSNAYVFTNKNLPKNPYSTYSTNCEIANQFIGWMPSRISFTWNTIISKHFKSGRLDEARQLFDKMPKRDDITWNTAISSYAKLGHADESLGLFIRMLREGLCPNDKTLASVVSASASLPSVGKQIHCHVLKHGVSEESEGLVVGNALIDMYGKHGLLEDARRVHERMPLCDEVSWSSLITGHVQNGQYAQAVKLFNSMLEFDNRPNHVTFASTLGACAGLHDFKQGSQVHAMAVKMGYESYIFVGNSLLDMYVKCEDFECALKAIHYMPVCDVVSWTSLIVGYCQKGRVVEALNLFSHMRQRGMKPDSVTVSSILSGCGSLATSEKGKQLHAIAIKDGITRDEVVGTSLLNMYAKSGDIKDANVVFDSLPKQSVISWNAMITGYGQNGEAKAAISLFQKMLQKGVKPNSSTFIGILSACCHAGLVKEGYIYFKSMSDEFHITPRSDHYACVVDLLGRAGCLDEAEDFIKCMPIEPDSFIWSSLLNACKIHHNIEIGIRSAEKLIELEPQSSGPYILLSNLLIAAGKLDDASRIRKVLKNKGIKKSPGFSWIEVKGKVHTFVASDRTHPQTEEIYEMLDILAEKLKHVGYVG